MKRFNNFSLLTLLLSFLALPVSCTLTGEDPDDGGTNLDGEMTIEVDEPLTVSYTHLTLPTILLV